MQCNIPNKLIWTNTRRYSFNCRRTNIRDTLHHWRTTFCRRNISEPDSSAEFIIAHVFGKHTLHNVDVERCLTPIQTHEINRLCEQRLSGMPVQYVLGEWSFHEHTLKMKPPVLIPRPETEELADLCTETLHQSKELSKECPRFLDIGCGSGALTVTLLRRFRKLQAVAVDISSAACELTEENATALRVRDRLTLVEGDFCDRRVLAQLGSVGPFRLVVSNPPYITSAEMSDLQPEIKRFEDPQALDGGVDGLRLIKQIIAEVPSFLTKGGHLWLEVAPQHPSKVKNSLTCPEAASGVSYVRTVKDQFGRDRFCLLRVV